MNHSRRRISALAAAAVALLVGGLLLLSVPATAAGHDVTVQNLAYNPASITVQVGDTVTWTNQDALPHTVTADDGSFDQPLAASGGTATITFSKAGTFTYHCTIHPSMHGTVVVEGQQATTPAGSATPPATTSPAPGSSATPSVTQTPNQACTLTVKDFAVRPGSTSVTVPDAQQVDAGYVVIHESTSSGGVGAVIGWSGYLPGGSSNHNLVVKVDRPLVNGEVVWPMLHTEGNGNHTYDSVQADPPTFSTKCGNAKLGNMVTFPARVTVSNAAAPEAPSTGSGVESSSEADSALFVILGGLALAVAIGSGAIVMMRRHDD